MKDYKIDTMPPNWIILYCYKQDLRDLEMDMSEQWRTEVNRCEVDPLVQVKLWKDYELSITYQKRTDWLYYNFYNQEFKDKKLESDCQELISITKSLFPELYT